MQQKESFLDIINEHLNSENTFLPVCDKSILCIQEEISKKKEPDLRVIEELIGRDPSLTAQVLRSANSAFYKGLTEVLTIRDALIRLGTGEISNIVKLLMLHKNFSSDDLFSRKVIDQLRKHSTGCAIGAQWLARQCHFDNLSDEAFIGGLLHDVGKLLLIAVAENLYQSDGRGLKPSNMLIDEVMENFHAEYGYLLLKNWNLPEKYCKIARKHHSEEIDPNDTLTTIIRLVNKACKKLGIGLSEDPSIVLAATPEANLLGLSEVFLAKLEIKLEDSLIMT